MWPPISRSSTYSAWRAASSGVSANWTPPAFIRPPVRTWDLITTGPPISSAIRSASSAAVANPCLVTGMPAFATTARDSYSKKRIGAAQPSEAVFAGVIAGCGGSSDTSGGGSGSSGSSKSTVQLALVGYSTPKKAYDALTTAFGQTSAGEGVTFNQSFGASGAQSRAVDSGQPAD